MKVSMIDKTEIEFRFRRSVDSYEEYATVQKLIVQKLFSLIQEYVPVAFRTLEIGCGTGLLSEKVNAFWKDNLLYVNDLVGDMCHKTISRCKLPASHALIGDIETIDLVGKFDLMISASTFQWLAQPERAFVKLASYLETQGKLIFSTFGKENFKELKAITGQGLEYSSTEELKKMLSPHFEILHTEEQIHCLKFNDPSEILRHVKKTGVNATPQSAVWTPRHLREFSAAYNTYFLKDGQYPLTYHPIYMVCCKK